MNVLKLGSSHFQEYFEWAAKVVKGLRGTNQNMEDELDKIFKQRDVLQLAK